MLRTAKFWFKRMLWLGGMLSAALLAWFAFYCFTDLAISKPVQFSLKHGSSLRSTAKQMQAAGLLDTAWKFELVARVFGHAGRVQAGNYQINSAITPYELLIKITAGGHGQDQITLVEGWSSRQMRAALDSHAAIKHDTRGLPEPAIAARFGITHASVEGLFFPDTYYFVSGASDFSILQRAYRAMQVQLDSLWKTRADGLPLENSYQALILASIIEKETGQPGERALIAAVFLNRLRLGMRLQTDPTVIYGLGTEFDGNLRKRDLLADGPYNTYTRAGLPPTPIAIPGTGALRAALNPASSNALYFVARGDGTSQFSSSLAEHDRAVTKYQLRGRR